MTYPQHNVPTESEPWPPCRRACPVHADVRSYVNLAGQGKYAEALAVIRRRLPYAAVCGRICHHPCEANCRRREVDGAVAIREIKRFVAEHPEQANLPVTPGMGERQRVAVIGGGPAGLSAALELARRGYRPTVFEKEPKAGGIPAVAIPDYRLPKEVLQRDIDWILGHGVELQTGVQIGTDRSIKELHRQGFAAVIIAVGLSTSRLLPLPGVDQPGVYGALDFLRAVTAGRQLAIGREILVIGGGNVACDTARTALRLGGGLRVKLLCLESETEMPALPEEIDEAREEGIELLTRRGPLAIETAAGRISGLRHRRVRRVFNDQGQFAPEFDDSDQQTTTCDTVIFAIGQALEQDFIKGSGLKLDQRGRLPCDPASRQTSVPWIFAAGEAISPPGSVVEACAHGKRTAEAVDQYLRGEAICPPPEPPPALERLAPATAEQVARFPRVNLATRQAARRKQDFAPYVATISEEQAVSEARRCLECGNGARVTADRCVKCLNCVRLCPYQAPRIEQVALINRERCLACGICHGACPTGAIKMAGGTPEQLAAELPQLLAQLTGSGPKTVAYVCSRATGALACLQAATAPAADNCARICLPHPGQLDDRQLLHTLEAGADTVLVLLGPEEEEAHRQARRRLHGQVARLRHDLAALGMNPEKIQVLETTGDDQRQLLQAEPQSLSRQP
ncbi:FAD-dependent oxidoreductase [Desulfurivibrio alkaliphilus]|uniref:FAD-dependent pyridine nucleotide-disulfide oxidoreductase n=1 Tax=Desulfurivibrio alkaliphilus (strain DSM 19089 / UNIQEM U267 / AHT2) TaxID=589865 RepID=D6Z0Y0_DESAT|nr:FAD-dependent oxidoreductase [Desulfurivibrio alkaliphilus]ADH87240.1 FAD-dependent pyridine nucleotide-disulfide oxidoreductase [Desulfurivibrio alkaliphilus AHT 2]